MLLAIDIGNTNITIGGIKDDQIVFEARIATDRIKTSDQYGADIKNMLNLFDVKVEDIKDCIIASVVPPVFNAVRTGAVKAIGKQPMVVGPGIKNWSYRPYPPHRSSAAQWAPLPNPPPYCNPHPGRSCAGSPPAVQCQGTAPPADSAPLSTRPIPP